MYDTTKGGKMMKCPCEECICYPICRIKSRDTKRSVVRLSVVSQDCEILFRYLYKSGVDDFGDKLRHIRKVFGDRI